MQVLSSNLNKFDPFPLWTQAIYAGGEKAPGRSTYKLTTRYSPLHFK